MKLCTSVPYHFLFLCLGFAETPCHDCVDVQSLVQLLPVKDTVLGAKEVPIHDETSVFKFPLPKTLEVLSPSDPSFAKLKESAEKYALNIQPGKGGIVDYVIVKNKEPLRLMRVWGGSASQCGYWWTLPKALAVAPNGQLTLDRFMSALGVCPEWNNGTFLEICEGVTDWKFVVGQGNSATCQWGNTIFPPTALLQVNGDVCGQAKKCRTCNLQTDFDWCWRQM